MQCLALKPQLFKSYLFNNSKYVFCAFDTHAHTRTRTWHTNHKNGLCDQSINNCYKLVIIINPQSLCCLHGLTPKLALCSRSGFDNDVYHILVNAWHLKNVGSVFSLLCNCIRNGHSVAIVINQPGLFSNSEDWVL